MEKKSKLDEKSILDKWAEKYAASRSMAKLISGRYTIKAIIGLVLATYFITIAILGFILNHNFANFTIFMSFFTNLIAGVVLIVAAVMNLLKKDVAHVIYLNVTVIMITILLLDILDTHIQRGLLTYFANYVSPGLMLLYYISVVNNDKLPLTTTLITAPIFPTAFASVSILQRPEQTNSFMVLVVLIALVVSIGLTYLLYQFNRLIFNFRMRFFDAYVNHVNEEDGTPTDNTNPWELLDYDAMKNLGAMLKSYVVGQEEAIARVEKIILKAYMGLSGMHMASSKGTPRGIMFFVGPTGVGKTELSKSLAKFVFDDDAAIIRFDMSEYAQENSDQKLIGAPPGFVGFKEGGLLTNAIKKKPFSIVLFDEIEKAAKPNPRILDLFLQILEDGRLTDSKGETVYFNESIIIFTSNLGAADIDPNGTDEEVRQGFIKYVKEYFQKEIKRPEILGRIGDSNIIPFNFIRDKSIIERIVLSKLKHVQKGISARYNINLLFEDELDFIQFVFGHELTITSGRTVLNKINDALLDNLAVWMFNHKPELEQYKDLNVGILASVATGELTFEFILLAEEQVEEGAEPVVEEVVEDTEQGIDKKAKKHKKIKHQPIIQEPVVQNDEYDEVDEDDDIPTEELIESLTHNTIIEDDGTVEEMLPEYIDPVNDPIEHDTIEPTDEEDPDDLFF